MWGHLGNGVFYHDYAQVEKEVKLTPRKIHLSARKSILTYLDETHITPVSKKIFHGNETDFDTEAVCSEEGQAKREIFFAALNDLIEEGLVTSDSSPKQLPIIGLKLTPKGLMRTKNIIDSYKEHGLKVAISATFTNGLRYILNKLE